MNNNERPAGTTAQTPTEAEVTKSSPTCSNTFVSRSQFKPILFSTPMVDAICNGRKTQTRRVVNPQPNGSDVSRIGGTKNYSIFKHGDVMQINPKFNIGDILWVREKWRHNDIPTGSPFHHYADDTIFTDRDNEKWKPSIFMPKQACRLFLEVTGIRSERLQDITEEDAISEGIELIDDGSSYGYKLYGKHTIGDMLGRKAVTGTEIESYQTLWQNINGVESWEINPYVWVITFKVVECPQGFC